MMNFENYSGNIDEFVIHKDVQIKKDDPFKIKVKNCDVGTIGSCKSEYFKVDNLFSELVTEYLKLLARRNLGIGDELILRWGSLTGNLINLKDLVSFIEEQIKKNSSLQEEIMDSKIENFKEKEESSKLTLVYFGPNLSELNYTTSKTFVTGDYIDNIYVLTPNLNTVFEVNGLKGGFEFVLVIDINGSKFYVFKSLNSKLGKTKITISYDAVS